MNRFITRNADNTRGACHCTGVHAAEVAQALANETGCNIGVYELAKEYEPKLPASELVPHDIDKLIENRARGFQETSYAGNAISCGILRELKKRGVTHLDLPPGCRLF